MSSQLDPRRVLDPQRFLDYERSIVESPLVPHLLARIDRPGLEICDVGGASGRFLSHLGRVSPHPFRGTVLEVLSEYREHLVDPELGFVNASIVDNQLEGERFDVVTARHVLHHLVGDSWEATRALQRRGLAEMLRLTRPGGHLVFQEQVHFVAPFARAVFRLSRFANRFDLRLAYFEAGKVVVAFLTPEEVRADIDRVGEEVGLEILAHETTRRPAALRWKLTVLMARTGDVLYVIRKGPAAARAGGPGPPMSHLVP